MHCQTLIFSWKRAEDALPSFRFLAKASGKGFRFGGVSFLFSIKITVFTDVWAVLMGCLSHSPLHPSTCFRHCSWVQDAHNEETNKMFNAFDISIIHYLACITLEKCRIFWTKFNKISGLCSVSDGAWDHAAPSSLAIRSLRTKMAWDHRNRLDRS